MLTARGKTILNFLEDFTKPLLALLVPSYLSNLQSYEFLNIGAYKGFKIGRNQ